MIALLPHPTDDATFLSYLETLIQNQVNDYRPNHLYLIRLDNWFDDKWLGFSGTRMHEISIWQLDQVTVPPFHPNRVESCLYYKLKEGSYTLKVMTKPLHIIQTSTDNLHRKITDFMDDGLFVWYSSNSKMNSMGAVMMYQVKDNECFPFYLSLSGGINWKVQKTKGITRSQVEEILAAN
ncbi:hypothetical protein [Xanthocytophaga flava]|uniref:hypothetical protein n=1 Tax=Xanthocytophaga flava TaxID=3048013 RepID=UPI0028D1BA01|nr:hypothetical protein [Xanthocytophaga flavus]MDJ1473390.1 hypothetical protein [Xanthocytophaga flavus]